jgi:hypothetical protein
MARGGVPGVLLALGARGGAAGRRVRLTHTAFPLLPLRYSPDQFSWSPDGRGWFWKHICTSMKDVLAIPPPSWRPWRRSAPGPALRSHRKTKGQSNRCSPTEISNSPKPHRGIPRDQVKEETSCED